MIAYSLTRVKFKGDRPRAGGSHPRWGGDGRGEGGAEETAARTAGAKWRAEATEPPPPPAAGGRSRCRRRRRGARQDAEPVRQEAAVGGPTRRRGATAPEHGCEAPVASGQDAHTRGMACRSRPILFRRRPWHRTHGPEATGGTTPRGSRRVACCVQAGGRAAGRRTADHEIRGAVRIGGRSRSFSRGRSMFSARKSS